MGILNLTPDSFSDGGEHNNKKAALAHAAKLIKEGADIIDIGGESTRPGATPVTPREEQRRVLPVIRALRKKYPTLRLSIDTRHASTARAALKAGADIINDVTGLTDPAMMSLCAEEPCGIVLMHIKGDPFDTTEIPFYFDILSEVRNFFETQVAAAEAAGISPSRICLDPGIGFRKSTKDNLELIHALGQVRTRDLPLLMGLSRKRFLKEITPPTPDTLGLELPPPEPYSEHDPDPYPTVAMSMLAAENGADVHRVHDVAPHRVALHLGLAMSKLPRKPFPPAPRPSRKTKKSTLPQL